MARSLARSLKHQQALSKSLSIGFRATAATAAGGWGFFLPGVDHPISVDGVAMFLERELADFEKGRESTKY
jgi:hypothetical protein